MKYKMNCVLRKIFWKLPLNFNACGGIIICERCFAQHIIHNLQFY